MSTQPQSSTVSVLEQVKLLEKLPENVAIKLIEHWNEAAWIESSVNRLEKILQSVISIASMALAVGLLVAGVPVESYVALIGALPALVIALKSNTNNKR
jgi:urea transporter